jgi:molybdopterin-synthase adenylyltransferase
VNLSSPSLSVALAEILEDLREEVKSDQISQFDGVASVAGVRLGIRVLAGTIKPYFLPHISVTTPLPKRLPHVTNDGTVCFDRHNGLIIDRHNPVGVTLQAVTRSLELLGNGLAGRNHHEFIEELKPNWLQFAPNGAADVVYAMVAPSNGVREIRAIYDQQNKDATPTLRALADDETLIKRLGSGIVGRQPKSHPAVAITLTPSVRLLPPKPGSSWTLDELRCFVFDNLQKRRKRELRRLLERHPNGTVLICVPRLSSGHAYVGFSPSNSRRHPLLDGGTDSGLKSFVANRLDRHHLLPRGGASNALEGKRVLLIGCGSLGSRVAELLATSGLGHLTLVDHDRFHTENLYRHTLGTIHLGNQKAESLKLEFTLRFPHLRVTSINKSILTVTKEDKVHFAGFDLVLCATGEPSLELELNQILRNMRLKAPPAIFTWLEPLGLGGHALLTVAGQGGCLECLIQPSTHQSTPLYNSASFAAYEQPRDFSKDLDGCGQAFMPFSALDASRTAEIAVRMALEVLESPTSGQLRSWKGDKKVFVAAGFQVSPRYERENLCVSSSDFKRDACPHCGEV